MVKVPTLSLMKQIFGNRHNNKQNYKVQPATQAKVFGKCFLPFRKKVLYRPSKCPKSYTTMISGEKARQETFTQPLVVMVETFRMCGPVCDFWPF